MPWWRQIAEFQSVINRPINITVEEEDLPIPQPPPLAVVGTAGDLQPAPPKRRRGRPKKTPVRAVPPPPPPQRPATPPPVLDATSRADFKRRCEARKAALGGYNKKLSPQEAHEKWTLLVEDNEDRSNCCGEWLWEDFTEDVPFINKNVNFAFETQGLSHTAKGANSELDFLRLFLTEPVLKNLVDQTNLYASQEGVKTVDGGGKYIPVTRESLMAYIGLTIAMGLTNKSKIDAYWSTNQILETPWFRKVMPRSLYQQHQRYLHVSDNTMGEKTADGRFCDKLYKLSSVHEGQTNEVGLKVWTLCDAKVHYCLNFDLYTGGIGEKGLPFRVVNELMGPYLGRGHRLYTDNFYTSPELLAHLLSHNTLAVGTVRENQKHMPVRGKSSQTKVEVGHSVFLKSHKMTACRWMDKRDVFCLSTVHGNSLTEITRIKKGSAGEREVVQRPTIVSDYNAHMGGVDVFDQLLSYHPIVRRYKRWWLKPFWRAIDMAILNAFALWKLRHTELSSQNLHQMFRLALAEQLCVPHLVRDVPQKQFAVHRLSKKHCQRPTNFETRRQCSVCKDPHKKIKTGCLTCGEDIRLHLTEPECFYRHHHQYD
ncbi:putative piggyBac transposable element-derived protein 4-like [Apostichopus japonicus]|uniref:Putative piggyBac transposable element-derived protein 4-like n=1 Tax=Stichopus japonicus TaxID=307972 RepID=A0A2G8JD99_STIJA|nr:putative piggyBac transposable element-derived protein 4-like [Apostichopus japonicus]